MIANFFKWLIHNIVTVILVVAVVFLLLGRALPLVSTRSLSVDSYGSANIGMAAPQADMMYQKIAAPTSINPINNVAPNPDITQRKMITNTNYSLQVKNVTQTVDAIKGKISELGGYVVDIYLSRPEVGESSTITFRVPVNQLDNVTKFLRDQAIKVVSENISGNDITDQYVNIQERLTRLEDTKKRLTDILTAAKTVDDIINVQNRIFETQDQIDNYTGQLKYLDGASSTTLVTAYLSTDEAGLPYTQPLSWRPDVIFKHAVRSLISFLQWIGSVLIWLGVFSVVIVPALTIILIFIIIRRRAQNKVTQLNQ